MNQSNAGTAKINPRSTGFINNEVYRKHTSERSLADEAGELQRCMQLGVATENVSPIRLVDFDSATNTLTTERVHGDELFHTLWNATYLLGRLRGHRLNNPKSEEHTSELQSRPHLVCRLLLEKKKKTYI